MRIEVKQGDSLLLVEADDPRELALALALIRDHQQPALPGLEGEPTLEQEAVWGLLQPECDTDPVVARLLQLLVKDVEALQAKAELASAERERLSRWLNRHRDDINRTQHLVTTLRQRVGIAEQRLGL